MTSSSFLSLSAVLSQELAALVERIRPSLVQVHSRRGGGSGIIWRAEGVIITNDHVVPQERAEVVLADGRTLAAQVSARDPRQDLASLKVEANDLAAAQIGDSRALQVGQIVLAMGNPLGRAGAVTLGIVSGLGQRFWPGSEGRREVIHAHLLLAPGNSGGPLVDTEGRVLGVNARIAAPRMAMAIPSHVVERFLSGAAQEGVQLGILAHDVELPPALREVVVPPQAGGVMIVHIAEGRLAERASLLLGDIVVAVDDQPVGKTEELEERLALHPGAAPLRLTILRAGQRLELEIRPERDGQP